MNNEPPITSGEPQAPIHEDDGHVRAHGGNPLPFSAVRAWASPTHERPMPEQLTAKQRRILGKSVISDATNAESLQAVFGKYLVYCPGQGFLAFNGRYWEKGEERAVNNAISTIRLRKAVIMDTGMDSSVRRRLEREFQAAENHSRIQGLLAIAKTILCVKPECFDQGETLLNVSNGVVDLRTGVLRPHRREDFCTRYIPYEFHPDGLSPLWQTTLREIASGCEEIEEFIRRAIGYSATGSVKEQAMFFLFGAGANGKSMLTDLIGTVLGGYGATGYALRLNTESLLGMRERAGGSASPDLLALKNRRIAFCSETSAGLRVNDARLKDITGGDPITARGLYEKTPVTFTPQCKIWISGNHMPEIRDTGHGFWRRMLVVELSQRFSPSNRKEMLMKSENMCGILAWLVSGAVEWYQTGLVVPESIRQATTESARDSDLVSQWIESECMRQESYTEPASPLYSSFSKWMNDRGERPMTQTAFGRRLSELGFEKGRTEGNYAAWKGLRLNQSR